MKEGSKFDEILTNLGTGRWNMLHFFGAAYWYMLNPPQAFSGVFLAPEVNYTCLPNPHHNVTEIAADSCSYTQDTLDGPREVPCTEFDFDKSIYTRTLTSDFNLICSNDYLRATYQSAFMFASIFGSFVSGFLADKYGRKIVTAVFQGLFSLTCLSLCVATNLMALLALRCLLGGLTTICFYMLCIEVCQVKHRSTVGVVLGLPWAVGEMLTGLVAYLIRDWRYFQLAISLPTLMIFPILYFINESPRWLILQGRHEEALRVLRRAEKINKATLPPDHVLKPMMNDIQNENATPSEEEEVIADTSTRKSRWVPKLASTHKMRVVLVTTCVSLFISNLLYFGLSLSGSSYSDNPFLYMVISGLMEVPAYTVTAPIISRWGRKIPTMIGFVICGVVILSLAFIPKTLSGLVMTFAMLGKLTISCSFMILFVYGAELLPTEVRLQGVSITFICEQIAATFAPYIVEFVGPLVPWLPSVIFGVSSLVASLTLIPLPETLNKELPDTVGDLERLWHKKDRTTNTTEKEEELEELAA